MILSVRNKVYKQLTGFPADYARRILSIFEQMRDNPYGGDIVNLGEAGLEDE